MASDNRDWYRDWWRKRTGYVERARFRMSEAEIAERERLAGWRRVRILLLCFVLALVAARLLR